MKLTLSALLSALLCSVGASAADKPNILFIIADQHMVDALSCAGNPYVKTPNLDRLAARGLRFTRSYVAYPLCVPSRASLFSSRMPHELEIYGNTLGTDLADKKVPTMGELMRTGGYETAYAGKWHVHEGFPAYAASAKRKSVPGFDLLPVSGGKDPRKGDKKTEEKGPQCDPFTAEAGIKFLGEKHNKPFLLTVSLLNPHDICEFPYFAGFKTMAPKEEAQLPPLRPNFNDTDKLPEAANDRKALKGAWGHSKWEELRWRQYQWTYYRLVEGTDKLIGDILTALENSPHKDNTIVIYTSDHGEMLGSHRMVSKEKLYEEAVNVPLIIAPPGHVGVVDKTHNVIGMDIMPTLLDYAGVAAPASLRGKSLRPLVEGKPFAEREYVASESFDPEARMIRTARYKYIRYAFGERREQFFDLESDPHEMKNLIGETSLAQEIERHRGYLADWMKLTHDLEEGKGTAILAKIKAREGDEEGK